MNEGQMKIGINGLGRIGKLTVWHHVGRRYFNEDRLQPARDARGLIQTLDFDRYILGQHEATGGNGHGWIATECGPQSIALDLVQ